MKKTLLILVIIIALMQFIQIDKDLPKVDENLEIKVSSKVFSIFKKACYDCHSNDVRWPWYSNIAPFSWVISNHITQGRKALNFSIWQKYNEKKKEDKLKSIYRTVYAAMPLQSYIWLHKEANLTKEERTIIRDWTGVRKKK